MKMRILIGVLLSAFLVLLLVFGGYVLMAGIALMSVAAIYEMNRAFQKKGVHGWPYAALVLGLCAPFIFTLFGLPYLLILYVCSVAVTMIVTLFSSKFDAAGMVASLFIHIYPTLFLLCMTLVYFSYDRALGLTASCLAFAAPEFSDAVAYFVGTFFGKHKLCPSISPKKTIEGSIGALLGGLCFGAILIPLQKLWGGTVSVAVLLLIGLGCGVFSQIGDLVASSIKRWVGIKDFSTVFREHGGVMDRIDSLMFCSGFVLICFTILTGIGIY